MKQTGFNRWGVVAAALILTTVLGCSTTRTEQESDIPWNAPASWEGVPAIPGMSQ